MMNCQQATEAMQATLDAGRTGRLPAAVQAHLESCAACRHAWTEASALEAGLAEVAHQDVPLPSPGFHARIMAAVRAEQQRVASPRHVRLAIPPRRMLAAAAALLLLIGTGVVMNRQPRLDTGPSGDAPRAAVEVGGTQPTAESPFQIDLSQWVGNPKQDLKELASAILATTSGVIDVGLSDEQDQPATPQATPKL